MKESTNSNLKTEEELAAMTEEEQDAYIQEQREQMTAMQEKNELKQRLRQIKCAQFLRQRVADFDEKNPSFFLMQAREEAVKVAEGAYGELYLKTIGFAMEVVSGRWRHYLSINELDHFLMQYMAFCCCLIRRRKSFWVLKSPFGAFRAAKLTKT